MSVQLAEMAGREVVVDTSAEECRRWLVGWTEELSGRPGWQKLFIRAVFFVCDWGAPGDTIHITAIASSEEKALSFCRDDRYFVIGLDEDMNLPHKPVRVGNHTFPRATENVFTLYAARQQDVVLVPRRDWNALRAEIEQVTSHFKTA